jgi:hypothetical protein
LLLLSTRNSTSSLFWRRQQRRSASICHTLPHSPDAPQRQPQQQHHNSRRPAGQALPASPAAVWRAAAGSESFLIECQC